MVMYAITWLLLIWCLASPSNSLSYPIFGTKRYHRAYAASPHDANVAAAHPHQPAVPYYNQFYDQPQSGYETENGYYYYPNHDYNTYGMPTYHGEYNPQPYYYAPAPKYSYYDDREVVQSNPLDDLHEEMLHEDQQQQERQRDVYGQDSWYENPQQVQRDELTGNFLRNLIAYNRQIDAEQNYQKDQENEYDDYGGEIGPEDYDYDPQVSSQQQYFDARSAHHEVPTANGRDRYNEIDDAEVRQLKSLAKHPHPQHEESFDRSTKEKNGAQRVSMSQYDDAEEMANGNAPGGLEYDENDDAWISWDRKRSDGGDSIRAFSNRKPSPVLDHFLSAATRQPATTTRPSTTTTSTIKPILVKLSPGQKEVVLPRPATPQRHLFAPPALDLIHNSLDHGADNNKEEDMEAQEDASLTAGLENLRKYDDNKKRSKVANKSDNIYDTIKQLIAMGQQLEKTEKSRQIHKRFVTNEEVLVHELESLKRVPI